MEQLESIRSLTALFHLRGDAHTTKSKGTRLVSRRKHLLPNIPQTMQGKGYNLGKYNPETCYQCTEKLKKKLYRLITAQTTQEGHSTDSKFDEKKSMILPFMREDHLQSDFALL